MTEAEWRSCGDPEPMVLALPPDCHQRELRLFAVACVRRVWHLLPADCRAAVEAPERFAAGQIGEAELAAVAAAAREARWLGNAACAPDAHGYAASAAVDASSVWPRTAANVLAATTCAVSAVGCAAGEADEARYDQVFEPARRAEQAAQTELLRALVRFPAG